MNKSFSVNFKTSVLNSPDMGVPQDTNRAHFMSPGERVYKLPLHIIVPGKFQPRESFNDERFKELMESIKSAGVIQPIIVRELSDNTQYEIVAGERRWRAAKEAGLQEIPAIVRDLSDNNALLFALIENLQRDDLNPLEEANGYACLINSFDMTHEKVAETVGKSRVTITNLLRLLNLEPTVRTLLSSGALEMGHARALLGLNVSAQEEIAEAIVGKGLSVRETEKLVQRIKTPRAEKFCLSPAVEEKLQFLKEELIKKLSSKVDIKVNREGKGKLIIHINSLAEVEWLTDNLVRVPR